MNSVWVSASRLLLIFLAWLTSMMRYNLQMKETTLDFGHGVFHSSREQTRRELNIVNFQLSLTLQFPQVTFCIRHTLTIVYLMCEISTLFISQNFLLVFIWYQCPIFIFYRNSIFLPLFQPAKIKMWFGADLLICVFQKYKYWKEIKFWSVIYNWISSLKVPSIIFLVALTTHYKLDVLKQCKYKISQFFRSINSWVSNKAEVYVWE